MNDKFGREIFPGSIVLSANKSYGGLRFAIGVVQSFTITPQTHGNVHKIKNKKFFISRRWNGNARRYEDAQEVFSRIVQMNYPTNMVVVDEFWLESSGMNQILKDAILADRERILQS